MGKKIEVNVGDRYGRLVVIEELEPIKYNSGTTHRKIQCICDCGRIKVVNLNSLSTGHTKRCGCVRVENTEKMFTIHGLNKHRLSSTLKNMKRRCYNKQSKDYKYYGGKGVIICNEWLNSLELFYNWSIKNGYKNNLTIDRIDSNGNYCPDNCRWITLSENISRASTKGGDHAR